MKYTFCIIQIVLMWDPPPDTYEASRDFISVFTEKVCSPFSRTVKPWEEAALRHIRNHIAPVHYPKDRLVNEFCKAWTHVVNQNEMIRKLKKENEQLSAKVISDHEEVISLHREIKNIKEREIDGLKAVVETAVDTSLKKSYSAVASVHASASTSPSPPTLDLRVMRKAIRDATEADERASNVVVFGLAEAAEEDVKGRVGEVLEAVGEKPHFEADRIGVKREGVTRPVLVKLRSGVVAAGIRRNAGKLKKTDLFRTVYICPDRTLMQRKEHKECVAELRRLCEVEPDKLHVIRDGVVISSDKEKGSGDRENG